MNLSKKLTDATGAQRGFKEIAFLVPVAPRIDENEDAFILKAVDSLLSLNKNLSDSTRFLESQGFSVDEVRRIARPDTALILDAMDVLRQLGVDTKTIEEKFERSRPGGPLKGLRPSSRQSSQEPQERLRKETGAERNIPSTETTDFNSVSKAENSGLPPGTIVTINGRRARID